MKQQPTKQEWDQLSDDKKISFWVKFLKDGEQMDIVSANELAIPNIGQMIEYLGEKYFDDFCKSITEKGRVIIGFKLDIFCDVLLKEVKGKLSK